MSLLQRTSRSFQKVSLLALKVQRKKKEEDVKSLERRYNYKMKKIVDNVKQKEKQNQKQRQRSLFLDKKHADSQNLFRLKAHIDEVDFQKKLSLKDSIFAHKVHKNKSLSAWEQQAMFEAHTLRKQKQFIHQKIMSQNNQILQQNRRKFLHSKNLTQKKKKQKESLQNQMKRNLELNQQEKWNKQYQKLQKLENQQDEKSLIYQRSLKKTIRGYYRLDTN